MPQLIELVPDIEMLLAMSLPQRSHVILKVGLPAHLSPGQIESQLKSYQQPVTIHSQNIDTDSYSARRREAEIAVLEAFAWMEAQSILVRVDRQYNYGHRALSLIGLKFLNESSAAALLASSKIRKDDLHPLVRGEALDNFWRGSYDLSSFAAMKAVEVAVREASGLGPTDLGVALMRKAFDKDNGPLTDKNAILSEREAVQHLFAGAMGVFKSPNSHRYVESDADTCADVLVLASRLLKMVEKIAP